MICWREAGTASKDHHEYSCVHCLRTQLELARLNNQCVTTFEEAWKRKEAEGYQYGADALEQVRFGWELREYHAALEAGLHSARTKPLVDLVWEQSGQDPDPDQR